MRLILTLGAGAVVGYLLNENKAQSIEWLIGHSSDVVRDFIHGFKIK